MNIKHRINAGFALFALVALAAFALFNPTVVHAMGFQMGVAASVAHLIVAATANVTWLQAVGSLHLIGRCDAEPTLGELAVEFKKACTELEKKQKPLEDALPLVQKAIADNDTLKQETKQKIDEGIAAVNEQKAVVKDLMQKMDALEQRSKVIQQPRTLKSALAEAINTNKARYDEFKSAGSGSKLRLDLKAITSVEAAGLMPNPTLDTLLSMAKQPLRIRNLLTSVPVTTDSVRYGKQTLRTNAAKIVAQGTSKPYSAYKWENQTATIETIAHLTKLTLQAIADAPRLTAEVEAEMRYGLQLVIEQEILNGDGTAGHLNGLMNQATAFAMPAGITAATVKTKIDALRVAQLQLALTFAPADAQIISLVDWADIELLRDGQDRYLFGSGPRNLQNDKTLWSLPVIDTASMATDNFLVGAFGYSVHLYDRQAVSVLVSTENDDDFETNQATMRCEERMGLGVRRPDGLVKGTFATAIPVVP